MPGGAVSLAAGVSAGFFGKMPSRGDFVRAGLPSGLVQALDAWWQDVLPGSRAILGEDAWTEAWMEAPIWRFLLPAGQCGAGPVVGLWLPSTDKAGRLFPLTIAATAATWAELAVLGGFLDAAEGIGIAAVERDVPPDQLAAAVAGAAVPSGPALAEPQRGTWWTAGGRLVAAGQVSGDAMPEAPMFAAMLRRDRGAESVRVWDAP